jgi:hypothetical protein
MNIIQIKTWMNNFILPVKKNEREEQHTASKMPPDPNPEKGRQGCHFPISCVKY